MDVEFKAPRATDWVMATVAVPQYTFMAPATREFGTATINLSNDDRVIVDKVISEQAGTLVKIPHPELGTWLGVQTEPLRQTDEGWQLSCHQIGILARNRIVPQINLPKGAPAGALARAALAATFRASSFAPLAGGSFLITTPLIEDFDASFRSLADVLADLADQSGQEWEITEDLVVNWVSSAGRFYDDLLVEGRDLIFLSREMDPSPLVGRVIAKGTNKATRWADAEEHVGNPMAREVVISVSSTSSSAIQVAAKRHLDLHRVPSIVYEFGLPAHFELEEILAPDPEPQTLFGAGEPLFGGGEELQAQEAPLVPAGTRLTRTFPTWALREGDLVSCGVPSAGLRGENFLGRVLSRTYGDEYEYPVIEIHWVPRVTEVTLPIIKSTQAVSYARPQTWNRTLAKLAAQGGGGIADLVPSSGIISVNADQIEGELGTDQIEDGAVTDPKIAAVAASKVTGTLGTAQYGNGTVTDDKIAAVATSKLTGTLNTTHYGNGSVTDAKIASLDAPKLTGTIAAARLPTQAAVSNPTNKTAGATFGASEQDMLNEAHLLAREIRQRLRDANLLP